SRTAGSPSPRPRSTSTRSPQPRRSRCRMTRDGALAGIVTGAVVVIAWKHFVVEGMGFPLYEIVPGFIAATIAIIAVSLLGRAPAQDIRGTHDEVRASLRNTGY